MNLVISSFIAIAALAVILAILFSRAIKQRDAAIEARRISERGADVDRAERQRVADQADDVLNKVRGGRERIDELEDQLRITRKYLEATKAARTVVRHVSANRMPEPEVRRAFAVDVTSPLWRAVHQELDDKIQQLVDAVDTMPSATFPETARLHVAGGLAELRDFQAALLVRNSRAVADGDLEENDEEKTKAGQGGAA